MKMLGVGSVGLGAGKLVQETKPMFLFNGKDEDQSNTHHHDRTNWVSYEPGSVPKGYQFEVKLTCNWETDSSGDIDPSSVEIGDLMHKSGSPFPWVWEGTKTKTGPYDISRTSFKVRAEGHYQIKHIPPEERSQEKSHYPEGEVGAYPYIEARGDVGGSLYIIDTGCTDSTSCKTRIN